jgi:hypothetical protein
MLKTSEPRSSEVGFVVFFVAFLNVMTYTRKIIFLYGIIFYCLLPLPVIQHLILSSLELEFIKLIKLRVDR